MICVLQKGGREIFTFLLRNSCLLFKCFPKAARMSYAACTMCSLGTSTVQAPSMEAAGIVRGLWGKHARETALLLSPLVPCRESRLCAAHCVGVEGVYLCRA